MLAAHPYQALCELCLRCGVNSHTNSLNKEKNRDFLCMFFFIHFQYFVKYCCFLEISSFFFFVFDTVVRKLCIKADRFLRRAHFQLALRPRTM